MGSPVDGEVTTLARRQFGQTRAQRPQNQIFSSYQVGLFPVAKPTAIILNWRLGPEGITFLRERHFRAFITKHVGAEGADVGKLEAIGAVNFLDLDDILVVDEGESIDPRSIIILPIENERPLLPKFDRSPNDPFLRQLNASGKKMGHYRRYVGATIICVGRTPFSARFTLQCNIG